MRTNFAGFALSLGMGLIVLLIGFVALSTAGLVSLGPPVEGMAEVSTGMPSTELVADDYQIITPAYVPANPAEASAIAAGDAIFKNNCTQCHAVNEKVVGPALARVAIRRNIGWITAWVHNSAKVIASGDVYAMKIYQDNGQQQMPSFPNLSDKDIKNILAWVKSQEQPINSTVQAVAAR